MKVGIVCADIQMPRMVIKVTLPWLAVSSLLPFNTMDNVLSITVDVNCITQCACTLQLSYFANLHVFFTKYMSFGFAKSEFFLLRL